MLLLNQKKKRKENDWDLIPSTDFVFARIYNV